MRIAILGIFLASLLGLGHAIGQEKSAISDTIYSQVDVIPQFHRGTSGWNKFVSGNLDLNRLLRDFDEETYKMYGFKQQAILEFTVCEDGKVCDVVVVNKDKVSPEFAEEVLRVMQKSPKWKPALLKGQPVKTRFRQPVVVNFNQ